VAHGLFDHTSVLKLLEWRWRLKPLTPRDAAAANPATALDFRAPNRKPPEIPVVHDPGPHLCELPGIGMPGAEPFWEELDALPAVRSFQW
jgi:phospholipase C